MRYRYGSLPDESGTLSAQRPPHSAAASDPDLLQVEPPCYEYADLLTYGGPGTAQGTAYALVSPFDTPSEWCVVALAFGGAGQAIVSPDQGQVAPLINGTLDPTARIRGLVAIKNAADTVVPDTAWQRIEGLGKVYLAVTAGGGNSVYCTLLFRRRVSPGLVYSEGLQ